MLVIWRGFGILVIVAAAIGGVCGLLLAGQVIKLFQLEDGPLVAFISVGIVGSFATLGCYGLQRLLAKTDQGRAVVDKATGEELLLKRGDSLFFIPVRWWTVIVATITIVFTVGIAISALLKT